MDSLRDHRMIRMFRKETKTIMVKEKVPLYKIAVMGPKRVGKTNIVARYLYREYLDTYESTFPADWYPKTMRYYWRKKPENEPEPATPKEYNIEILDVGGWHSTFIECFSSRNVYAQNYDGFMFVYSADDPESFEAIEKIRDEMVKYKKTILVERGLCKQRGPDPFIPMVLVANKVDKVDANCKTIKDGEKLAKKWGCPFFDVSAKTCQNVDQSYEKLIDSFTDFWTRTGIVQRPKEVPKNNLRRRVCKRVSKAQKDVKGTAVELKNRVVPTVAEAAHQVTDFKRHYEAMLELACIYS